MDLYEEGAKIIEDSQIEVVLGELGTVSLGGSYTYRTMVDRDLDYDVCVKSKDELSFEFRTNVLEKLSRIHNVRGLKMADPYHFPRGSRHAIEGIWFGLSVISNDTGERWNIDIWFVGTDSRLEQDDELTWRLRSLSEEERGTIVAIKEAALRAGEKEKNTTSIGVYRAVLEAGVKNYEEYKRLRSKL